MALFPGNPPSVIREWGGEWINWLGLLSEYIQPEFQEITPQWTTATADSNPAIGNGTLEGWYYKNAGMVTFSVRLVMGSTTTFGTAAEDWRFQVPALLEENAVGFWQGDVYGLDNGVAYRAGTCYITNGSTVVRIVNDANGSPWRVDSPHTWANNDEFYLTITYKVDT